MGQERGTTPGARSSPQPTQAGHQIFPPWCPVLSQLQPEPELVHACGCCVPYLQRVSAEGGECPASLRVWGEACQEHPAPGLLKPRPG